MVAEDGPGTPVHPETAPYLTTPGRSRNMAAIRRRDTKPEVRLRSALHRLGYRFRKDYRIRVNGRLVRPDIAFTKRRVAIFVDGCFWHSCPEHGRQPGANGEYWSPKLAGNVRRDRDQTAALQSDGWCVLRFWEHEDVDDVVAAIEQAITWPGETSAPGRRNHGVDHRLR
ncbi:MAG: very short patch repair endonuclease [Mycolicibacterium sp.]|uniref:Very short patch repair endonuclease n=1 Tax=Mycolicibacterium insubricum TaxID=444597 RepID=A0A1X0D6K4_9MYCO|nr:very short patch repair endonuclease [Mycolicibacterium insubricum]MCB9440308.1 very short patch repair endonuclease [Mycolicibacterium sp.]MCV7081582.1 very short patch repair endonuclease [Mycolicibacterium insubricum]ORA68005.1 very short patch repair endonuclease [Mycolicibacterium insubricum]